MKVRARWDGDRHVQEDNPNLGRDIWVADVVLEITVRNGL
jgi:hypothetical protein